MSVGGITYEALVAGGTMTAEHTSVAEVLAAVARYSDPSCAPKEFQMTLG